VPTHQEWTVPAHHAGSRMCCLAIKRAFSFCPRWAFTPASAIAWGNPPQARAMTESSRRRCAHGCGVSGVASLVITGRHAVRRNRRQRSAVNRAAVHACLGSFVETQQTKIARGHTVGRWLSIHQNRLVGPRGLRREYRGRFRYLTT
jgi:hypothetical protein